MVKQLIPKVIIFDGDDTLWECQTVFNIAKENFEKLMSTLNFKRNINIIELLDKIDLERMALLKFKKSRFLESMIITYGILCGANGQKYSITIENNIREMFDFLFNTTTINNFTLYPDTLEVLRVLSKHFTLILLTQGEKKFQKEKIDSFGTEFRSFFKKIYITEDIKSANNYLEIIKDLHVSFNDVWVVGNSIKSDINPALELGIKTIQILRDSWKYEKELPLSDDFTIVSSLTEVKNLLFKYLKRRISK